MPKNLDPRLQPILDIAYAEPAPEPLTVELMREGPALTEAFNTLPKANLALDQKYDFNFGKAACRVEVFHPEPDKALPVLFYFPGTGFSVDYYEHPAAMISQLAKRMNHIAVSVSYRLAPEHPYPAAIDDCEAVITHREAFFKANQLLVDTSRYAIAGCSSGGYIASAVIQRLIKQAHPILPKALQLHVPLFDFDLTKQSYRDYGDGFLLDLAATKLMCACFLGTPPQDKSDTPEALADFDQVDQFPPTLITYAECDPLFDDAKAYEAILNQAGVKNEMTVYHNMPHASFTLYALVPDVVEAFIDRTATFFKKALGD